MKKKEALLVIDMLNDFVLKGAPLEVPDTRKIIPELKREIEKARKEGTPVIYICDNHDKDDREFKKMGWLTHAVKGTKGAEVVEDLKPLKGEKIIKKKTYSGFYKTKLDEALKRLGVKTLKLTGCVTNICVLFTASEGALRGYEVQVPEKCVAGLNKEDHEFALRTMKNVLGVKVI